MKLALGFLVVVGLVGYQMDEMSRLEKAIELVCEQDLVNAQIAAEQSETLGEIEMLGHGDVNKVIAAHAERINAMVDRSTVIGAKIDAISSALDKKKEHPKPTAPGAISE